MVGRGLFGSKEALLDLIFLVYEASVGIYNCFPFLKLSVPLSVGLWRHRSGIIQIKNSQEFIMLI